MKNKIVRVIPFLTIIVIVAYTWFQILTTEYTAMWRHYVALVLILINAALYFWKYNQAIIVTGIILLLGTFNLLSFFTIIHTSYFGFGSVTTPEIQTGSLLLLAIYAVFNLTLLINWYLDFKEKKAENQK